MSEAAPAPASSPKSAAPRRGRFARYLLGFIAAILLVDAIVGEKGLLALMKARRDFQHVERALEQSRHRNAELREQARRLREDPRAVEEVARRELGLIKPGEKLFIVREAQKK
jgi:cell division protein FtsB